MKPVYMINGFLESGKTEFLSFTLSQDYFRTKGTTLLLLCEEGEKEYDPKLLKKSKTVVELIEREEDFQPAHLLELEKKWNPERILIEYNGMWSCKDIKLPFHWTIEQQITTINAVTFPMYYNNMRSLVADAVRGSELIIFNRCDEVMEELGTYKRNIKAVNPKAEIIFEGKDGEINQIFEEDLPYDLKQDVLELDNLGYGIWYIDSMDHLERYVGKTVVFPALVMKPKKFPKGYFIPGRMAMTCCADDMAFIGYVCKYEKADELKEKQWVQVTAKVCREHFSEYRGEGPVLHALTIVPTKAPEDDVISFGR